MQIRIDCPDEKAWLAERFNHIGGSDASAVIGASRWKTNVELFTEKVTRQSKFVSNEAVAFGNRAEPALRMLYGSIHPNVRVDYHQYTIIANEKYPFIGSTLDGEIIDYERNCMAILEIKTALLTNRMQWDAWKGKISQPYYVQVCHQLLSCGEEYKYVDLFALLTGSDGDSVLRTYHFERNDLEEDMAWLLAQEERFWKHNVLEGICPAAILPDL